MADDIIARLAKLDSCALSDALDSLDLPAAVTGLRQLSGTPPVAGRAVTVKLGTEPPAGGTKRHLCTGAIEAANAGDVIVVEQRTGRDAAGWGGVLSNAAKVREIAGVIVEGPARDIDEAKALEFPVFARNATARTARGRVFEQDFDCPVTVGDITVSPGDYVFADSSGTVFIPQSRVDDVLAAAERIVDREGLMTKAVWDGKPVGEVMGADYETMLEKDRE